MKTILAFFLFFYVPAFAGLNEDFLALKDNGSNLQDTGAICEEVAQLEMQRKYSSQQYVVLTGITYSNQNGTIGELDVVVFERMNGKAVLVAEVKCWKDMREGLQKAYDQRGRFLKHLRSGKELTFKWLAKPNLEIKKQQFAEIQDFATIAQKGSRSAGYDLELAYSLDELMQLRQSILRCQSAGQCKRPATPEKDF